MTDAFIGLVPRAALIWVGGPNTGISSKAIFNHMIGNPRDTRWLTDYPHDPSDLGRCRRLLEAVPEWQDRLAEMRGFSEQWSALIDNWDRLCAMMDDEAPNWRAKVGRCPETYRTMSELTR